MKCLAVVCMVFALATGLIAQESPVIERLDSVNAWINWERQVIKAVGVGVLPGDVENPQEAERLARQAAGINAYRNIEAAIRMARVHGETLVGNVVTEVPEIRLKQLAHSAEVISDRQQCDRSFEVILQVPLAGVRNLIMPMVAECHGGHSLHIDARGLDIAPTLNPKVFDEGGNEVYSGLAVYSMTACEDTCAPIVKAMRINDLTDIVISDDDGEKLQWADARVMILVNPTRESDKRTPAPSPN